MDCNDKLKSEIFLGNESQNDAEIRTICFPFVCKYFAICLNGNMINGSFSCECRAVAHWVETDDSQAFGKSKCQ